MTALLTVVGPPELTLDDERLEADRPVVEPDEAADEAYVADPVEVFVDQWFRLVTAPFALVAPGQVDAARDAFHRFTHVDELM